jgi:hypothetical protein
LGRFIIGCEESQAVCNELRALGHEAFSVDVLPCSGGNDKWHLQCDVREVMYDNWDVGIFFPPCTNLSVSGARWFLTKRKNGQQQSSIDFFRLFTKLSYPFAIENPIGIMSTLYRKPDQIIQP